MRRLILSTESGANLPEELANKHNVQVVPIHGIKDGQDYLDGSLTVRDIYNYYVYCHLKDPLLPDLS